METDLTEAALRLPDECVVLLSSQLAMRPLVRDERLVRLGCRWMPVGGYMAFFTLDEPSRTVNVERILYGQSNWRAVL